MKRPIRALLLAGLMILAVVGPSLAQGPTPAVVQQAIRALLAGNNTWTGTNTFTNVVVTGTCTGCGGGGSVPAWVSGTTFPGAGSVLYSSGGTSIGGSADLFWDPMNVQVFVGGVPPAPGEQGFTQDRITVAGDGLQAISVYSSGSNESDINLRAVGNTLADPHVVASGDYLGGVSFQGIISTLADFRQAAGVFGVAEGSAGANAVPGRLEFWTSDAGGFHERARIDSAGFLMGFGVSACPSMQTASITLSTDSTGHIIFTRGSCS